MSKSKFADLKKKLLAEAQIPDDKEVKTDTDVDSDPDPMAAQHLPIHQSDAAEFEPQPVLDKLPKRDTDSKDLKEAEDEDLEEAEDLDEGDDEHSYVKEMAMRMFESEKEDLDEDEDLEEAEDLDEEDELEEAKDEDLEEAEDLDEEDELEEAAVDEITPSDLEEMQVGQLTDIEMHNKIEEMDDEHLEEGDKELEESEEEMKEACEEMEESIKTLLKGQKLSEEARKKISALFEGAVAKRVANQKKKIVKVYNRKLQESKVKTLTKLVNELDEFHEYAVAEWMKENKLAVEKGIRTQLAEEFIVGLKNLFLEHNFSIPDEDSNLLELSLTKLEKLEKQLNEQYNKTLAEAKKRKAIEKELVLREAAEKLSEPQAEKLRKLCEHVAFTDRSEFEEKIKLITENYFGKKAVKRDRLDSHVMNSGGIVAEQDEQTIDPTMRAYVSALSSLVKDE